MGTLKYLGASVAKRKRTKKKQERIFSTKGLGHATQVKNNDQLYQVFFHADTEAGKVIQIGTVDRATALEMLKEIDLTGEDYEPAEV